MVALCMPSLVPPAVRVIGMLMIWCVGLPILAVATYRWVRRRPFQHAVQLVVILALLFGAVGTAHAQTTKRPKPRDEQILIPDECKMTYCPWVASGEMSWWTALFLFGCWC